MWAYLELRQHYSVWYIVERLSEILRDEDLHNHIEELAELRGWLEVDRLDRRAANRRLRQYAANDEAWQWR